MDLLEQHGVAENTLIIFLSDNGMAFPFAKTNCYLNSTQTPFIVRWSNQVPAGVVNHERMVNGIDIFATILEAAQAAAPIGIDSESFLPLVTGNPQGGRSRIFTQFHQTASRGNFPMRCIRGPDWGYIWNPWSNGERRFRNESMSGRTFEAMRGSDESSANERADFFQLRVPEELYDFSSDPHALHNRIDDPACAEILTDLTKELEQWMIATEDPALAAFQQRHSSKEASETLIARMADWK